jgi:ATP-binding cassette subfamily E protein 1
LSVPLPPSIDLLSILLTCPSIPGIEVASDSRLAFISESLCIGCGICPKKCPFSAITIINLPTNLESQVTHRYSANSFKLHRLPMPRPGQVLGLVGTNGIGKSTALKILSGKLKPNLGRFDNPPDWEDVIKYFRGSELQNYFTKLLEDDLTSVVKPQYVDQLPRAIRGPEKSVEFLMNKAKQLDNLEEILDVLELRHIYDRDVPLLSGGELQRFAIGVTCVSNHCNLIVWGNTLILKSDYRCKTRTSTCSTSLRPTWMSSSVWLPPG